MLSHKIHAKSQTVRINWSEDILQTLHCHQSCPKRHSFWPYPLPDLHQLHSHRVLATISYYLLMIFKLFGLADSLSLQADLNHIQKWAERWLLSFNISKCSVLHFGPKNENTVYSMWNPDKLTKIDLQTHNEERALGVLAPNQLKFHFQARNVVSKSNARLGLLKRSISNRSPQVSLRLYKAVVKTNHNFGNSLATPQYKGDTRLFEDVQRPATKVIDG